MNVREVMQKTAKSKGLLYSSGSTTPVNPAEAAAKVSFAEHSFYAGMDVVDSAIAAEMVKKAEQEIVLARQMATRNKKSM